MDRIDRRISRAQKRDYHKQRNRFTAKDYVDYIPEKNGSPEEYLDYLDYEDEL